MWLDHFSENVNAGTALKLSYSSSHMLLFLDDANTS